VLVLLAAFIYRGTFATLWRVWMDNPSYSHGALIPPVVGVLVWLQRKALARVEISPSRLGIPLVAFALLVQLAGIRGDVLILQGDSFILLLAGLVLHFMGWPALRLLAFPILYLVFMVPFLPIFESQVSFRLKQLAASGAVVVSNALGMLVERDGMSLYLPTGVLRIENACSGMQSLISLLALGALFAHLANGSFVKRALLFLAAVPIALAVNVLRISGLCVVGSATTIETASGFFHDASGFVLFGLGFGLLLLTRRMLRC